MLTLLKIMLALFAPLAATAQTGFPTPNGSTVQALARLCPNQLGQMVPCSSAGLATYSAAVTALGSSGTGGDHYCIRGSATKALRMRALYFSATATAAIVVDVNAVLRSSAAAGGTPSNPTIVANDSNNSASTALITAYATAPTPGTAVGTIGSEKTLVSAPSSSNYIGVVRFLFGESQGSIQPLVLRGASQFLCLNTSALGAGASIDISSIHTED